MKKAYMTPEIEELNVENMNLLCSSVIGDGAADDLGFGGDGTGLDPESPLLVTPESLLGIPF